MGQSADVSTTRLPRQFRRRPTRLSLVVVIALAGLSTLVSVVSPASGPLSLTTMSATPVIGDADAVNADTIRVSSTPRGGPESPGSYLDRVEVVTSEDLMPMVSSVGRSAFVDCDDEPGVTPETCRSATPASPDPAGTGADAPGPSSQNESSAGPRNEPESSPGTGSESVPRDLANRPATPQQVKIVGRGGGARLQWEMPPSAPMGFQITRNSLIEDESDELWGQLAVTPGHQDLIVSDRGDGGARFTFPVGQFSPGDNFVIQAFHPYSVTDDKLGQNARFSESSRYATIINPGSGSKIPNFFESLGSANAPSDPWIGSPDDWNPEPQFSDEFNGSGELANSPGNQWYFARNDGEREITPSYLRDQNQTDDRAILADGQLVMSAGIDDGAYSYLGSANDQGEGYLIDPTNGVFVEASVRLDQMSPADNAWWAFWLMAPGNSACDSNGDPIPGAANAYDGHAETGTEVDLFEFVPDLANGFNQAIFRYEGGQGANCTSPGEAKLAPGGRNFTYEGPRTWPEVDMPDYMDGNYHRLGLYYAQDCYAVYMDDELLWQVTEASDPGWVTPRVRQSIRLTWEIQNSRSTPGGQINNPWTSRGGNFANTALDRDPTVFVDYVNVWEKKESANGLCSGGPDPEPDP